MERIQERIKRNVEDKEMYQLIITVEFRKDLRMAVSYIKDVLKNNVAAEKLKTDTENAGDMIERFPYSHPIVLFSKIRFVSVGNYLVFYEVVKENIFILRFLHGTQNWTDILKSQ
ncbi:MAG: type II toxin-antitoxin system RelE/ParE family toxin [Bacteroidales bacterium]|jgi:plasmid stabilization system protein ParE|nr:type II toxin-antitoxin system RelE/ParE family toxin [Bacteroidales bacterium]